MPTFWDSIDSIVIHPNIILIATPAAKPASNIPAATAEGLDEKDISAPINPAIMQN
jgi:hypothetical protein